MVFKCQEDSFLKEFTTEVISCEERKKPYKALIDGQTKSIKCYEVVLADTILFPEGGGQPSDYGFINDQRVYYVERREDKAYHYVEKPLKSGDGVKLTLDWGRRLINMQHHSGQHLLSAILERDFAFNTVSWYLGEDSAYVELDTPKITEEQIKNTENICNELIRDSRKVSVKVYPKETLNGELASVKARGLPDDHVGDIRVINIEGVDDNMCCGTHVNNLSQLQFIVLLNCEKSKRKGNCLLHFVVGERALRRFHDCINRESRLTALLKTNPVDHPEFVEKLQQNIKTQSKNLKNILAEFAVLEAERLNKSDCKYYVKHVTGAENDYVSVFLSNLTRDELFVVLSIGPEKGAANFVIRGAEDKAKEVGERICKELGGKGSWGAQRFQGKLPRIEERDKIAKIVESCLS